MTHLQNRNGLSVRTWMAIAGIVLLLIGATARGVAMAFNTFASKDRVDKIENVVGEVRDNLRDFLIKQGHEWKYRK